jgi:hypothetical protein
MWLEDKNFPHVDVCLLVDTVNYGFLHEERMTHMCEMVRIEDDAIPEKCMSGGCRAVVRLSPRTRHVRTRRLSSLGSSVMIYATS